MKRFVDIVLSALCLVLLLPLFAVIALLIALDSPGPILFRQTRIGRGFRPFEILKFRSMADAPSSRGFGVAAFDDPRVTRVGRVLRRTKLDELPQLVNVLNGDMSLVGPRPEIARYVDQFRDEYAEILAVRPGITDFATLEFRDESAMLEEVDDPDRYYLREILPRKIVLSREYVRRASFSLDLQVLLRTIFKLGSRQQ